MDRQSGDLLKTLMDVCGEAAKLCIFYGPSKQGKTVSIDKLAESMSNVISLDGSIASSADELYEEICFQLQKPLSFETSKTTTKKHSGGVDVKVVKGEKGTEQSNSISEQHSRPAKFSAIDALISTKSLLIVDDFHMLSEDDQLEFVRSIKSAINKRVPIVLVGIETRGFRIDQIENELVGRTTRVQYPAWSQNELRTIIDGGCKALNILIGDDLKQEILNESCSSPHLVQDICRAVAKAIAEGQDISLKDILERMATDTAFGYLQKILDGKAQKGQPRKDYRVRDSELIYDVYRLNFLAMKILTEKGLESFTPRNIADIVGARTADNESPSAQQLAAARSQMKEIMWTNQTVIFDVESETHQIRIVDPFFKFYLRWGFKV